MAEEESTNIAYYVNLRNQAELVWCPDRDRIHQPRVYQLTLLDQKLISSIDDMSPPTEQTVHANENVRTSPIINVPVPVPLPLPRHEVAHTMENHSVHPSVLVYRSAETSNLASLIFFAFIVAVIGFVASAAYSGKSR